MILSLTTVPSLIKFGDRFVDRTIQGIVQDGCNALLRYYYNNFRYGAKQVCEANLSSFTRYSSSVAIV